MKTNLINKKNNLDKDGDMQKKINIQIKNKFLLKETCRVYSLVKSRLVCIS